MEHLNTRRRGAAEMLDGAVMRLHAVVDEEAAEWKVVLGSQALSTPLPRHLRVTPAARAHPRAARHDRPHRAPQLRHAEAEQGREGVLRCVQKC